jgi:hypothetical protein
MFHIGLEECMEPRAVVLKASLDVAHFVFNSVVADLDQEMASYRIPGSNLAPGMAIMAHALLGEDVIINKEVRNGELLLIEGGFAQAAGVTDISYSMTPEWIASTFDVDGLRAYAAALFAQTDAFLSSATPEELDRKLPTPIGSEMSAAEMIGAFVVVHLGVHTGEVSALKGAQAKKGLPF